MKGKGAQITFVFLFILLIIVGFFLWYWVEQDTRDADVKHVQATTVISESEKLQITEFVVSCLEDVTERGLDLLGKQGGRIYESQGGIDPDYQSFQLGSFYGEADSVEHESSPVKIPFLIRRRTLGVCTDDFTHCPTAGHYPWKKFPYEQAFQTKAPGSWVSNESPMFGKVEMPPLYKADGAFSMEEKISTYIENHIHTCIDNFAIFEDRAFAFDMRKDENNDPIADVSLRIATDDFTVTLRLPFTVEKNGRTQRFSKFVTKPPIRFPRIYNTVLRILQREALELDYHLADDSHREFARSAHFGAEDKGRIFVKQQENSQDDFVQIVDMGSEFSQKVSGHFQGRYFTFSFFRQNRNPVLYYVSDALAQSPVQGKGTTSTASVHPINPTQKQDNPRSDWSVQWGEDQEKILVRVSPTAEERTESIGVPTSAGLRYNKGGVPRLHGNVVDYNGTYAVLFVPKERSDTYTGKNTLPPCRRSTFPCGDMDGNPFAQPDPADVTVGTSDCSSYPPSSTYRGQDFVEEIPNCSPRDPRTGLQACQPPTRVPRAGCVYPHTDHTILMAQILGGSFHNVDMVLFLNATDPDEDEVTVSVLGRPPGPVPLVESFEHMRQIQCCREGGRSYRIEVSDGELTDFQNIVFPMDQALNAPDICHYQDHIGQGCVRNS